MLKRIIISLLILMIMTTVLFAQSHDPKTSVVDPSRLGLKPKGFLDNLLDPNKFSMSHSYSLSFFNVGNQSVSQGLYLNTMNYRFSDPLFLQVRIGFAHQPFGGLGQNNGVNGNLFLQRARLQYKPSDKMTLTIDYQQLPSRMYSPYGYPYRSYRRMWEED